MALRHSGADELGDLPVGRVHADQAIAQRVGEGGRTGVPGDPARLDQAFASRRAEHRVDVLRRQTGDAHRPAVGIRDRSPELAAEAATRVRCLRDGACESWHLH